MMMNAHKLQELLGCGADRTIKNHEGKLAQAFAKNPEVKAELEVLTPQGLLYLSTKITSEMDLKKLAIFGLKISDHLVDKHLHDKKGEISSAAHKVLQDWRKSIESPKVAYKVLWEALGVTRLNGLREALFEGGQPLVGVENNPDYHLELPTFHITGKVKQVAVNDNIVCSDT